MTATPPDPVPPQTPGQQPPPPMSPPPPTGATAVPPVPPGTPMPTKDDTTMAMLAHLLGIFTGFVGPLIIWLVKKDQSKFVDDQGKEALNWQITVTIASVVAWALTFVVIGCVVLPAVVVVNLIFAIKGTMAANNGQWFRYPNFCLRLVK